MTDHLAYLFIFPIMAAISARIAGGGFAPHPSGVGEALFAIQFAVAMIFAGINPWSAFLLGFWVLLYFQTGHGTAFHMGADPQVAQSGRKAPLSFIVDPACRAISAPLGGSFYCWSFMGLKGLLIHLPLGLWALAGAFCWPFSYWFGNRFIVRHFNGRVDGEAVAELLSGALSGLVLWFYVYF